MDDVALGPPVESTASTGGVPGAERDFYIAEFSAATLVVSLDSLAAETLEATGRAADSLAAGGARLILVFGGEVDAERFASVLPVTPLVLTHDGTDIEAGWLAELWLAITEQTEVVVAVPRGEEAQIAARLAAALRARKLVVTDPAGGWGLPARSFANVETHESAMRSQLGDRNGGMVISAISTALAGGVVDVNLCRAEDLDRELFTFDGVGTLFTSGDYVELDKLRVDDLAAVERLVAQGTSDGFLRPRSRLEVARLAVTGLGARVRGSGHLAGIVSLETEPYEADCLGEVACLYSVSRFSGSGAGGMLIDGLLMMAEAEGLHAVFAVTVSDAAARFFERRGFVEVPQDQIPPSKWAGYDASRRSEARAFWRNIGDEQVQGYFNF